MNPRLIRFFRFLSFFIPLLILFMGVFAVRRQTLWQPKATGPRPEVVMVDPLLHPCHFHYFNCRQQAHPASANPGLNAISLAYDLNPNLLAALATILEFPLSDQDQLTKLARTLSRTAKTQTQAPIILDHPRCGLFRFTSTQATDYFLVRTLCHLASDQALVLTALTPNNPGDGQISGFNEIYQSLSGLNPQTP